MASIDKRPNGTWRARWREYPGGPQRTRAFARKVDAQEFMVSIEHQLRSGTYVDPAAGKVTLREWWVGYYEQRADLQASTEDRNDVYWRHQIEPALGDVPLSSIDRAMLRNWVGSMSRAGVAPRSVRKAVQLVRQALEVAVEDNVIATNPADRLRGLPKVPKSRARFCTVEEVSRLVDATDEHHQVLVATAAWSGLRLGELTALRRRNVDLMRRRISVVESASEVRGKIIHSEHGKTDAAHRAVPLPRHIVELLTEHTAGMNPDDLVFTAPEGGWIRRSLLHTRVWQPATIAAGLGERIHAPTESRPHRTIYRGLRIHDLRHTAVSLWIAAGADYTQLKRWAGHESIATLIDTYGHLMPDREAPVLKALDKLAAPGRKARNVVELEVG
jgi:integrase